MYAEALVVADEILTDNARVRAETATLREHITALLFEYRRHRFFHVSGGSDAADAERVRSLLRKFCATNGTPKSYVGPSKGSVCQACGNTINAGDVEYDLVTPTAELRVDGPCYGVFVAVTDIAPGTAAL